MRPKTSPPQQIPRKRQKQRLPLSSIRQIPMFRLPQIHLEVCLEIVVTMLGVLVILPPMMNASLPQPLFQLLSQKDEQINRWDGQDMTTSMQKNRTPLGMHWKTRSTSQRQMMLKVMTIILGILMPTMGKW